MLRTANTLDKTGQKSWNYHVNVTRVHRLEPRLRGSRILALKADTNA